MDYGSVFHSIRLVFSLLSIVQDKEDMPVLYVRYIYLILGMDLGFYPCPDYRKCMQLPSIFPYWLFPSDHIRMDSRKTYPAKGKGWI